MTGGGVAAGGRPEDGGRGPGEDAAQDAGGPPGGIGDRWSERVTRVLAPNPSPMTLEDTKLE